MILKKLENLFDNLFRKDLALSWDKVGLSIGKLDHDIKRILFVLDITSAVIDEAIDKKADLIISHHPLIFNPVEKIRSDDALSKRIIKLIENNIAVYSAHTNYDLMNDGLNDYLVKKLGLESTGTIEPISENWYKFVVFVPMEFGDSIRNIICKSGGGEYGNYSCCTFSGRGKGTFRPEEGAEPHTGKLGGLSNIDELRIECIVSDKNLGKLIEKVISVHPYEEVAYDVYRIENTFYSGGIGRICRFDRGKSLDEVANLIKENLGIGKFRYISEDIRGIEDKKIKNLGIMTGSANSLTPAIIKSGCELVILGEVKYHNALDIIESGKILFELGHGRSEIFAIEDMYDKVGYLTREKNIKIELIKAETGFTDWRIYE